MIKLSESTFPAAVESVERHTAGLVALEARLETAEAELAAVEAQLTARVLVDPSSESGAATELAEARARRDLLGRAVDRAQAQTRELKRAALRAAAESYRADAAALRAEYGRLQARIEKHLQAIEDLDGERPQDTSAASVTGRLLATAAAQEQLARGFEYGASGPDPEAHYKSLGEALRLETAGA